MMTTATTNYTVLASYTVAQHQRQLVAERVGPAQVRVFDAPEQGDGETHVVDVLDLELDGNGALRALVTEYLAHAAKLDAIPMARSLLGDYLEQLNPRAGRIRTNRRLTRPSDHPQLRQRCARDAEQHEPTRKVGSTS